MNRKQLSVVFGTDVMFSFLNSDKYLNFLKERKVCIVLFHLGFLSSLSDFVAKHLHY